MNNKLNKREALIKEILNMHESELDNIINLLKSDRSSTPSYNVNKSVRDYFDRRGWKGIKVIVQNVNNWSANSSPTVGTILTIKSFNAQYQTVMFEELDEPFWFTEWFGSINSNPPMMVAIE